MPAAKHMNKQSSNELSRLRERLAEAEAMIAAIRNGEVDALVVSGQEGDQVYTLQGADQPYRLFVESMQQGALTVSPDGTILYANRRFAEMTGTPLERVIGSSFAAYLSPSDRADITGALKRCEQCQHRAFLQSQNGALTPAQLAFVKQETDGVTSMCVVVTDTTDVMERQILTEALDRLRTAQQQLRQQNHDLQEARQAAEAASSAKDQFLAQLSHELRTPLTPVMMALGDLEGAELPPIVTEELNLIRRNVELQAKLIDDLLDLSRVVTGKMQLSLELLDLHDLIKEVISSCVPEYTSKGHEVSLDLRSPRAVISGDPIRLRQVFWNIFRNAVKFTPKGGRITITTEKVGEKVSVVVQDNGIGISKEALERIFSPFEQASQGITRQFGGMGLGLAIAHRMVLMHGGTVAAASEGEGKGASFRLELPLADVTAEAARPVVPTKRADARRRRILLVEDHEDTRALLSRLLGDTHTVETADSVQAAVAAARAGEFDLLISDLGLPDGTGYQVMEHVMSHRPIPGIALSGFGADVDIERSRKAGFLRHLVKPVALRELLSAIEQTLSNE